MILFRCSAVLLVIAFAGLTSHSQTIDIKAGNREPSGINAVWADRMIQGFDMRVWLSNQMTLGLEAWDGTPPNGFGLEYPAGSGVEHLYGAGPRIGAIIDGKYYVDEGYNGWDARKELLPEYRHLAREHFWRTAVATSVYDTIGYFGYYYNQSIPVNQKGIDDDNDGHTDEDVLDGTDNDGDWDPITDDVGADGLSDAFESSCDGKPYDPVNNPDPAGDNYDPAVRDSCHPNPDGSIPFKNNKDRWTEKNGIPDHGERHVDEDHGAVSDNDLYCSAIDTFTTPVISGHLPMGTKAIQKSYAWNNAVAHGIIFLDYSFVNMRSKTWHDAYIGFFADMDIGPVNVSGYYLHNYSAYDSVTRTAYIHNPIDRGSTPLGLTVLSASKPFDSLKFIYQWSDFTTRPDPGTNDSAIYSWMSGAAFADNLIASDQPITAPSDTRFFFSFGPFPFVNPNDTLESDFALVSGINVDDMLKNARRAHRIHAAGGFIMPVASVKDSGSGLPIRISWSEIENSPYGSVTSYRVYHGTTPGQYTDSTTTADLYADFSGLSGTIIHYFAVAAIDDKGSIGALSDELTNAPAVPKNFRVDGLQTFINLQWEPSDDPDFSYYNIYRSVLPDTSFVLLSTGSYTDTSYLDNDVWGDKVYLYKISSVDGDGHESNFTQILTGRLIPPSTPRNFVIGPGKTYIALDWSPNADEDLAGYNIYRRGSGDTVYTKLNAEPYTATTFTDSEPSEDSRYYYIEAVDTTDAISQPTPEFTGHTVTMDQGILVINNSWGYLLDSTSQICQNILQDYQYQIRTAYNFPYIGAPSTVYSLGDFSTVVWLYENPGNYGIPPALDNLPVALRGYLLGGGNLLIMGRRLTAHYHPYWYEFLSGIFGIDSSFEIGTEPNFSAASGLQGFPSVEIDQQKVISMSQSMGFIERFPGAPTDQVLYTYISYPTDTNMEGKPVGLRSLNEGIKAYYLSFPLVYLDSLDARELLAKVLADFGEFPLGVASREAGIPDKFCLYDAYPNPFNPATKIRFDLPVECEVTLSVYDLLGREVTRLVDSPQPAGKYEISWDAGGSPSGIYFYRLDARGSGTQFNMTASKKIILMK